MSYNNIRILLIEDDEEDYILLRDMISDIKSMNIELKWVQNLEEALYISNSQHFDVYLVDYRLGEHTGMEFLNEASPQEIEAPIILLTGEDNETIDELAIQEGASDYLVKGELSPALLRRSLWHALDRKKIEKELKNSENRYKELVEKINSIVYVLDKDGIVTYINPVIEKITLFSPAEIIGQKLTRFVYPADLENIEKLFELSKQEQSEVVDFRILTRNKEIRWVRGNANSIFHDGEFQGIRGILQDITSIKQRQEDFTKLYMAIEQTDDIVVITDNLGKIEYVNQSFIKTTGFSFIEVLGKTPAILSSGKHKASFFKNLWETILQGRAFRAEFINRKKNGELFYEEKTITPVIDEFGHITHFIATGKDITAKKKAEKEREKVQRELFQAQKMEIIGRLTGGIAHDFNNMLMAIQGNAQMAMMKNQQNEELQKFLQVIYQTSQRAAHLTNQLLLFSRKDVIEKCQVQINEVIEGVLKMLRRLIRENIEIDLKLSESLNPIKADVSNIEQVIMNLVLNAQDAMPRGGRITIETYQAPAPQLSHKMQADTKNNYVYLKVSDVGVGMSKKIQSKIFEPLFTTKPPGKGTGLGLSVVRRIVDDHQGWIGVESWPGKGTSFSIGFPVVSSKKESPEKTAVDSPIIHGKGEKILIIEDDESVQNLLISALRENGFKPAAYSTVEEAEQFLNRHGKSIKLIITDIILTGKSGLDLLNYIKIKEWEIPIIFSTGYVEQKEVLQGLYDSGYPVLRKPYNLKELLNLVRHMLTKKMDFAMS